jgi:hypothetical protein
MRTILVSAFLVLSLGFASSEAKRPPKGSPLCSIKTVYVAGYSEPSFRVAAAVKKETWLKVVPSPEDANAVLEFHETWGEHNSASPGEHMTITAVLKDKNGNLWSGSQLLGDGAPNSEPKTAAQALMSKLNEAAGGCK